VTVGTAAGLVLALGSSTLTNVAYVREHEAAAAMPSLSMRRPLRAAWLLASSRSWLIGVATEAGGFLLYALALALAPLALVQSVAAGGIGILAFVSSRMTGRSLSRRASGGAALAILGLLALAASLAPGGENARSGSTATILLWLGGTGGAAALVGWLGRRIVGVARANAVAAGLLFSVGDISTKVLTSTGVGTRAVFLATLVLGYLVGTVLLQVGYQAGGALTVAGLATLLTNAVPIAAATTVLHEPLPHGAFLALRVLAFAAVSVGAVLLAQPDDGAPAPAPLSRDRPGPQLRGPRAPHSA
jgi:hypothetical protein